MRCLLNINRCPLVTVIETIDYEEESKTLQLFEFGDLEPRYLVLDISFTYAKSVMKTILTDDYYDFSYHVAVVCSDDEEASN